MLQNSTSETYHRRSPRFYSANRLYSDIVIEHISQRPVHSSGSSCAPLLRQVGVHIADVSYFVRHDSLLDLEARARGTTVYLVDRRFDMLPKLLSEDLCSLVGGQDRLAVSVIWHVDPSGPSIVGRPWFGRTVIHNRHQLSYPQV